MNLKTFITRLFSWWNDQTFGTQLWTWRHGEFVGADEFGNSYYREKDGRISPALGYNRRWVIYNGVAEASRIPPAWHAWMHYLVDVPPMEEHVTPRPWWKPHKPNLTGLPGAYRPPGSTLAQNRRPAATGDYRPWTPNR